MVLVDTSVWVDVLRDRTGRFRRALEAVVGDDDLVLTRFTQLELLQGARDEREWGLLADHLIGQDYLEVGAELWSAAARTFYDLRRVGRTVRSPIDCLVAQQAIDHGALLVHRDRDFEAIATLRPLRESWLEGGP